METRPSGLLLVGDIGGTKTALAVVSGDADPRSPLAQATFPSSGYPSLEAIVREFLAGTSLKVDRASFGVAGPVIGSQATITNLPWIVDAVRLRQELGLRSVRLVNDLVAMATAVPHLTEEDLLTLNPGRGDPHGAIAVIAPGTGLGEAFLTWDGTRYRAHPSEGGHADFAPRTPRERDLLAHLEARGGHVSYERVCSGLALPHLYAFLRDTGAYPEPPWLARDLAHAPDPTPVIVRAALDRRCDLAGETLRLFVSILGAEAGNLALKVLATGGVYLGGGIPRRIVPFLQEGTFLRAFSAKGRLSRLLEQVPVHVIVNPAVGLLGAAYAGEDA